MKRNIALLTLGVLLALPAIGQKADEVYKSKCQMCHGADFTGNTPAGKKMGAKDLHSPEVQKMSDADWIKSINEGVKRDDKMVMPASKGKLSEDQIRELVGYIRSMCKTK